MFTGGTIWVLTHGLIEHPRFASQQEAKQAPQLLNLPTLPSHGI